MNEISWRQDRLNRTFTLPHTSHLTTTVYAQSGKRWSAEREDTGFCARDRLEITEEEASALSLQTARPWRGSGDHLGGPVSEQNTYNSFLRFLHPCLFFTESI